MVLNEFRLGAGGTLGLPSGLLLHGPTGCGKSMLVAALAGACHLNILACEVKEKKR